MQGRKNERAGLDRALERARSGESSTTLICGEAGIGKTSLCAYAAGRAHDFTVLSARGVESESRVAFAGLSQLLTSLVGQIDQLPDPQRRALTGALAIEAPVPTPPLALGMATLNLLAGAADGRPLLAIIDDAQWFDAPSLGALTFAARRLDQESVALLFAQRSEEGSPVAPDEFATIDLDGLSATEAAPLLAEVTGRAVPPDVVAALIRATGGNPLALIEAASSLSVALLTGRQELPDPLPLDSQLAATHARRLAELPEDTRNALVVLGADATGSLALIEPALKRVGLSLEALAPAESAAIVQIDQETAAFRHPLMRSAAFHSGTSAQRRNAHRALAAVATDEGDRERAAWHLAASTIEPDEAVAAQLEDVARAAELVGGALAAAPALERAARLTPPGPDRDRRLVAAASARFFAGRIDGVSALLDEAMEANKDPLVRADGARVRGQLMAAQGKSEEGVALVRAEAHVLAPIDVERAALMLCEIAVPSTWYGNGHDALAIAHEAQEMGLQAGGFAAQLAADYLAHILVFSGDRDEGVRMLWQVHEAWTRRDGSDGLMVPGPSVGLLCIEAYEEARAVAREGVDEARALGAPAALMFQLGGLAEIDFCTGDWVRSYSAATECVDMARTIGNRPMEGYGLVGLARIDAAQGREAACQEHLSWAAPIATGSDYIAVYVAAARGLLELSLGDPEAAYATLAPLPQWLLGRGWAGMLHKERFPGDLVEAAVLAGRRDEAQELVDVLQTSAEELNHVWGRASMARCRALLAGDDDAAESHFLEALALHESTTTPFETARTELRFGEWLRRNRPDEALAHLRAAHAVFDHLGATPWEERARRALRAAGEEGAHAQEHVLDVLTAQELQVALVVAEGATNKEAAASLFLSRRTVECHLGRAYQKLGIRSRSQLTRIVLTERG